MNNHCNDSADVGGSACPTPTTTCFQMPPLLMTCAVALLMLAALMLQKPGHPRSPQWWQGVASPMMPVPQRLQRGTATFTEAMAWTRRLQGRSLTVDHYPLRPNGPRGLFIWGSDLAGATGNVDWTVFQKTLRGYRFVGELGGSNCVCTSPDDRGRPRVITTWNYGGCEYILQLYVLTRNGFRSIASREIHAGDCDGAAHGNRIWGHLISVQHPAWAYVRHVFRIRQ